jgi:high-affinity K+ transport system ATPase subunit B
LAIVGNSFLTANGISDEDFIKSAVLSSYTMSTPEEKKHIVELAEIAVTQKLIY